MPSFTSILSAIFIAYVAHSIYSIASLFVAPSCEDGEVCLEPALVSPNNKGEVLILYSRNRQPSTIRDLELIDHWEEFDLYSETEKQVNFTVPSKLKRNGTAYLHIFLSLHKTNGRSDWTRILQEDSLSHSVAEFTQYQIPEAEVFNLIGEKNNTNKKPRKLLSKDVPSLPVTHLRSKIHFNVLQHPYSLPKMNIPGDLGSLLTITKDGKFLPPVFIDPLSLRIKDLVKIDRSIEEVPVQFLYSPISFGKLRVWLQFSQAVEQMKKFGFSEKDVDEMKGIFTDTNVYFLCLTFAVAGFHMLFDILAFKNDISFWREKKSMIGLSARTVIWRGFSQTVIFLYLLEEDTSLLVTIPSGIACLIEYWKITIALKIEFQFAGCFIPRVTVGKYSKEEQETDDFDADFLRKMSYVMCPLVICGAAYSLIYMPHKSWYSWTLQSLVNGVYAFGFLFMLPQLFVNYKLKSVAHLPWKAFMYKAFNTFIDDIFSFIITMPTSHRLACFRDDIVFVVYLYQRWLYPVDKKRVNEFGGTGEEKEKEKEE